MNMLKRFFVLTAVLALMAGIATLTVDAKAGKTTQVKSKAQKAAPGSEKKFIKSGSALNSAKTKVKAPHAKGGPVTRGGSGILHVDNHTGLNIEIYANGQYFGTVGPYGDLSRYADGDANWTMYAVAHFTDGSESTWGPRNTYLYDGGTFTWSLY